MTRRALNIPSEWDSGQMAHIGTQLPGFSLSGHQTPGQWLLNSPPATPAAPAVASLASASK